jgi:outer membrane protein assembly factor BamA
MNLRPHIIMLFGVLLIPATGLAQLVKVEPFAPRRADTVIVERNWRTREKIILAELEFRQGDTVYPESLETSLKKIWNLQNFVTVDYRWDSLPGGKSGLILTTRDALTIYPVFGGRMQSGDFTVKAGISDRNFLGRNIRVEARGQFSTMETLFGEFRLTVPRQLLWKNLALTGGLRVEDLAFQRIWSEEVFIHATNPFHEDYRLTLSPDLEIGLIQHYRGSLPTFFNDSLPSFKRKYAYIRLTETFGTITRRRHQEEGFSLFTLIGTGIGLEPDSKSYFRASLRAEYDRIMTSRLQLTAQWEGHYTSNENESFWQRYGPGNIRGIGYGDLSGPLMHLASAGLYYTWLNWDYLAVEQSLFVQYASAWNPKATPASLKQHYAIGTGFQFTIPMYPAASLYVSFSYSPNPGNWFYVEL